MISNHEFLNRLCSRSAAAVIAQSGIRHPALLSQLRRALTAPPGAPGSFLAEPVIEGAFGWQEAPETMADLAGLLDPALIDALDKDTPSDPQRSDRYRFARAWHPYTHQVEAWRTLLGAEPRSALVTSGTGSGKTECFLIPILQDLVRMRASAGQIAGVRALMLYPLNALINSQRDRLFDWTEPFGADIRFCLYNGATPHEVSSGTARLTPNEVRDRASLRANPPPILVTNITMLEYMLIRAEDEPILARSRGKLRWIVLDEAHSYVGSQAAELALLLRRVMRAFEVDPAEVRVVATSATIGEGEDVETSLAKFLGDISNCGQSRVRIIKGQRETKEPADLAPVKEILDGHFEAARRLRLALAGTPGLTLRRAGEVAFGSRPGNEMTLELVERAAHAVSAGTRYLPVRLHLVHRAQPGVWVCPSQECPGRSGTPLESADWPFGAVQVLEFETCPHCRSILFELVICQECGEPHLVAEETVNGDLRPPVSMATDNEFAEGVDYEVPDGAVETAAGLRTHFIAMSAAGGDARSTPFNPRTGRLLDEPEPGSILLRLVPGHTCTGCGVHRDRGAGIRPVRFGAPFLLGGVLPQMLERADPGKPDLPGEGRQLITFTDSRQGTARFAARLQQDSERSLVRGVLYHAVQSGSGSEQDRRQVEELTADLAKFEALPEGVRQHVSEIVAEKRRKLEQLLEASGASLPWNEAVSRLAAEPALEALHDEVWQYRDPMFSDLRALSRVLLLREFARRPRRANSAETLGLVALRYPLIDKIEERHIPEPFARHGGGLDDWKSFLCAIETLTLRGRGAVDIAADDLPWIGPKIPLRVVLAPDNRDEADAWRFAWPHAGRGSRSTSIPVKLLAHALTLDFDRPDHADDGNAILDAAFRALQPLLKEVQGGWRLDLSRADITRVSDAWLCPVTSQVLPWTVRGMTPWQPMGSKVEAAACPQIRMPRLPKAFPRTDSSRVAIDRWLDEDADVAALREKGIWTNLHDRVARFSPLLLAAEHSAQQPGWKLRWFERRFREGRLNILSCSTTMEMGVDIGGLQTVVNTNVPPSPANYRQRVGRAGRRREAISTALTFAKDEPLGWNTYADPLTPLKAEIRAPSVSLQSSVIVQRHVNALLLGEFIRRTGSDGLHKLTTGAFFGRNDKGGTAEDMSAQFRTWCRSLDEADLDLRRDLAALVRGTCLEAMTDLRERTAARCEQVAESWRREWESLTADLSQTDMAANRRISIQLQRLCGASLLGELGDRGFLPSHGFPTDVVPFLVPDHKDGRRERDSDGREFGKRLEVPSRSLDLAIRDYAPGTEVVLDGLVYRSAGVTLNWKRPADENTREIQSLRFAWRCDDCDASGDAPQQPAQCPDCGSESLRRVEYLRPAGFTFDETGRDRPHTDVTRIEYVEPTPPFVSASGAEWLALPHPETGRMRAAPAGSILYRAEGLNRAGFALCLHCGRADAEPRMPNGGVAPPLPRALENHRPLRAKGRAELCSGNHAPFGIKRNLTLGHFARTDVFELQLEPLATPASEKAATSIAVAMREALARRLGVESSEIGYAAAMRRRSSGRSGWSILLFDRAPGGAGYATQAAELVAPLLRDAARHLDCKAEGCVHYCPACILMSDSRFEEDKLDRQEGLAALRGVLPLMELPERFRVVDDAVAETRGALDAIRLGLVSGPVTIFFGGDVDEWDPSAWSGRRLLDRLMAAGIPVRLAAPKAALGRLATGQRLGLYALASRDGVTLHEVEEAPQRGGLPFLAAAGGGEAGVLWVIAEPKATSPGPDWGLSLDAPLVRGSGRIPDVGPAIDPARLSPPLGEDVRRLLVDRQLDGSVRDFGPRFWSILAQADPDIRQLWSRGAPVTATYTDRYLFSPLPLHLLLQVLGSVPGGLSGTKVTVRSQDGAGSSDRTPQGLLDNWPSERVRGGVMRAMLRQAGLDAQVELRTRKELPHDRLLSMSWSDGSKLEVTLDQGFGFWRTARMTTLDFTADITEQATRLANLVYLVEGQKGARTPILIGANPA